MACPASRTEQKHVTVVKLRQHGDVGGQDEQGGCQALPLQQATNKWFLNTAMTGELAPRYGEVDLNRG